MQMSRSWRLVGLTFVLAACGVVDNGDALQSDGAVKAPSSDTSPGTQEDLAGGGSGACVEFYSPDALRSRAFAFDGTVVRVGPSVSDRGDAGDLGMPGVTFAVNEWFLGGASEEITVDMQGLGETGEGDLLIREGSRLLLSGEPRWGGGPLDQPVAWGCGFSRLYDEDTAASWRRSTHP
ncbi:hypothetical protein GCM10009584_20720 [Ornithinimicrobium humiphilum]|uniref:hypothetical protein n=1 Tax=Ornithinimicrobium humiphilum TaxID=125288 RepID=UPI00114F750F|nr:hypothetical protein [Ornithinimicrobium humiphilum]